MRKLSVKWVPECLNADQKRDRVLATQAILHQIRRDPVEFFNCLVTMDETWIHVYDLETKGRKLQALRRPHYLQAGGLQHNQKKLLGVG
jgi:hypothetical protein